MEPNQNTRNVPDQASEDIEPKDAKVQANPNAKRPAKLTKAQLSVKDKHAYKLILWSLLALFVAILLSGAGQYILGKASITYDGKTIETSLEVLKYVVMAALGYFFGTNKSNDKDKD